MLIVSYTPTARSPRVLKQIAELRPRYDVTTAGYGQAPDGVHGHIELHFPPPRRGLARIPGIFSLLLLLRLHRLYVAIEPIDAAALEKLRGAWDVVIAHDAQTLHVATRLRPRFGVLADMHEYAPEQNEPTLRWRILDRPYFVWLCRTFATQAVAATTVSPGIVEAYRERLGVAAQLVTNATPYFEIEPSPVGRPIRLVHSGVAAPDRRLEVLIEAVRGCSADVTLDLYLLDGVPRYKEELVRLAGGDGRITFQKPVPYATLITTLAQYDVGVHVIAPTSFNNAWSLPNKFFDYVQARLGVVIGPSPAMVDYVSKYGFGQKCDGFDVADLRRVLNELTPEQVARWKDAAHLSARELSGEEQAKVWGSIVDEMVTQ